MSQSTERHRPTYHFLPPANWMNDPNGLLQWRGRYHLFYQYNPNGAFHGTIHWGHTASDDLVRWRDLPIALAPTPEGPDKDGVFSGCAVNRDGVPTLVYTGIAPEVHCIAEAADPDDPDLAHWRKHPANPVIAAPPAGLHVAGFRDPFVWREHDGWYCAIGSGLRGGGGVVLLYRSADLVQWEYLHELCSGDAVHTGHMWECPNFFPLGDEQHVLLVSSVPLNKVLCLVGEYGGHRFTPQRTSVLYDGGSYYAPQVMIGEHGRRLMWGWLREARDAAAQTAAGWSGVMSLPTELSLTGDGNLCVRPVPELASLRATHRTLGGFTIQPSQTGFDAICGTRLEIQAVIVPGAAHEVGLYLFESPDGVEATRLFFDTVRQELVIDRERASLDPATVRDVQSTPLRLGPDGVLTLRVFLDGSVIEVFANDGVALASRVYPTLASSCQVRLFATSAAAQVCSFDVWDMLSVWPDRGV